MRTAPALPRSVTRLLPARRVPVVTVLLFVVLWIVFALESVQKGGSDNAAVLFRFGATTSATLSDRELWRLVASTFVHRGLAHIAVNALVLLVVGSIAETLYGRLRYLALYLAGGVGGAVTTVLVSGPGDIGVGASGALYGLAGATIVATWTQRDALPRETARDLRLLFVVTVPASLLAGLALHMSIAAHIGGFVTGTVLALVMELALDAGRRREAAPASNAVSAFSGVLIAGAAAMLLTWFGPHHGLPSDRVGRLIGDGIAHLKQGNTRAAIADDTAALRIDPHNAVAYDQRGLAKFYAGDARGALADYNRALALDRRNAYTYLRRGLARGHLGDLPGMAADESQALRLLPSLAAAYYYRGVARANLHDTTQASADLQRAATLFAQQHDGADYAHAEAALAALPQQR